MSIITSLMALKGGGRTDLFFGDSITLGYGVPSGQRWSSLYCAAKGNIEENHGVIGSPLQNSTPLNPTGAANFKDSAAASIPNYDISKHGRIFISFGTNDVGLNLTNFTAKNYKLQLKEVINISLINGWPKLNIIVEGPSYFEQLGRDTYVGQYGVTVAADLIRHLAHNTAALQACSETGVVFDDSYTYLANNGANTLLQGDGLHPNVAGHAAKVARKLML